MRIIPDLQHRVPAPRTSTPYSTAGALSRDGDPWRPGDSAPRSALPRPRVRTALGAALSVALGLLCAACVYSIPIEQGNYIDPAVVSQVKVGMTRSQVRYLLGTPLVPNPFDQSRWDYDYYYKTRSLQTPRRSHVVIYFAHDRVTRIDSNAKRAPVPN